MHKDYYYESCGCGRIRARVWATEREPKAVVQLVHGIAEHIERYDDFAQYLTKHGFLVVAEDHMGHGKSMVTNGIRGYFHGGWFSAVEDTYQLMLDTQKKYPNIPYVLFGHSMGSFIVRTILSKYPDAGVCGCIISGTAWQPQLLLTTAISLCDSVCRANGSQNINERLHKLIFGGYNKRIEHVRTPFDWLTRDNKIVDAYISDPLCGFTATAGLLRDMLMGIVYIQKPESICRMKKDLPVLFIAGGDDPVGNYGKGVKKAASAFKASGMQNVSTQLYPLCRHEVINEINREEVYTDLIEWIKTTINNI